MLFNNFLVAKTMNKWLSKSIFLHSWTSVLLYWLYNLSHKHTKPCVCHRLLGGKYILVRKKQRTEYSNLRHNASVLLHSPTTPFSFWPILVRKNAIIKYFTFESTTYYQSTWYQTTSFLDRLYKNCQFFCFRLGRESCRPICGCNDKWYCIMAYA